MSAVPTDGDASTPRDRRTGVGITAATVLLAALLLTVLLIATTAGAAATTAGAASAADASAEREGETVTLSVPASAVRAGESARLHLTVGDAAAGAGTDVTATRRDDRYVATVPVTDLVGPTVTADRSSATLRAHHAGDVVLEDAVDLRVLAPTDAATFDGATLTVPVDARGLGTANASLALAEVGAEWRSHDAPATVDGVGPGATLRVRPEALAALEVRATYRVAALVGEERVPGSGLDLSLANAASRASRVSYPGGEPALVQPLVHPAIGPETVELRLSTRGPDATYVWTGADERGLAPIPAEVASASTRRATVVGDGGPLLEGVRIGVPARERVALRVENGTLNASTPASLAAYDAILFLDGDVSHLAIDDRLREEGARPLPDDVLPLSEGASAVLVGPGARPAAADLDVVVPEDEDVVTAPTPPPPDAEGFLGIWANVGDGLVLLVLGMVGGGGVVGAAYGLRCFRPARRARPGLRGIALHFVAGGAAGVVAIAAVQRRWTGTLLSTVDVAGVEVGLGALLVGSVYGGIVAAAFRSGLGSTGAWPTSYVAGGPAVPVRVRVTDDAGDALPGEQTVEVRRPGTGRLLRTLSVSGATTEFELSPGEYGLVARTGERETDPRVVTVSEPERTVPEPVDVALVVSRPGLQVEVADAETGESVDGATVRVTTDSEKTRTDAADDGSAQFALPIETGTVTVVADADGYEQATVEQALDEQLRTVDVALEPVAGELVVTARVDGEPTGGVAVQIAPADDGDSAGDGASGGDGATRDGRQVGERTAALETDADGRARTELPVGSYAARLQFTGPNADLFDAGTATVDVGAGEPTAVDVPARFYWSPCDNCRERAASLRQTIDDVASRATADPTIPLYFADVTASLLDVFDAIPRSGHQFATASTPPDAIAQSSVDAAAATLAGVGTAMGQPAVRAVLTASTDLEPERVSPTLDASVASMLEYVTQDVTVATVEARAERVRERVDEEAASLGTVAPARTMVQIALQLPADVDARLQRAGREYAALRVLDAVEQLFDREPLRQRLAAAPDE